MKKHQAEEELGGSGGVYAEHEELQQMLEQSRHQLRPQRVVQLTAVVAARLLLWRLQQQ